MLHLDTQLTINSETRLSPNLCDEFSADDLISIGGYCHRGYTNDKQSRAGWESRMEAGLDLAMQIATAKNFPWPGCSNVVFPLISIAALQFSARSYSNIIQGTDVVRMRVIGEDPSGELTARSRRIGTHMSWQVTEQDTAWEEQHDRELMNLSVAGFNFIKTYFKGSENHNVSELVLAQNLVFDYWATSIEDCQRKTQLTPLSRNEVVSRCRKGTFRDITKEGWFIGGQVPVPISPASDARKGISPPASDEETPFIFHEQHCWLDCDGDDYAEPYIVTYESKSKCVVRIVARWEQDEDVERNAKKEIISIKSMEYFTKFGFIPSPDGSIYDIGFGILLGPLNEAVNSGINQLIDAGTMSNSAGGILGRGAKFKGGVYTMAPWEWKRLDSTGDDIRKSLFQLPVREPSMVLFKLLELLINYTQRLSGSTDIMQGVTPGQNTPAETSRNALNEGMQIYSTIFKRVWRSMKEEFKKLHRLNSIYLPIRQPFGEKGNFILREDYKSNGDLVVPVADPNVTSDTQRVQRAQAVREAAGQVPGYDRDAVEVNFLQALRVEGISKLFPGTKNTPPAKDPKLAIEELRMQMKSQEMKLEWQKFQLELAETRRLNTAQIAQMEAQALSLMADANDAKAKQHLAILQVAIDSLKHHNDVITERMSLAQQALQAERDSQVAEKANATATE